MYINQQKSVDAYKFKSEYLTVERLVRKTINIINAAECRMMSFP